ncbi:epoxide hydrolase [Bacterioplanes sanyensis]|uniref:alpha/beta fold hydrolase n=1 Tax=Bacterioplanes sanyensis TaxID=1249553 RepID=UPI0016787083|nr:alpha/beta fold hydrolase [Bacterioplanes sanyensis]GGY54863.1 epoxide hydrolase [Bacterioplanes sanyensis]
METPSPLTWRAKQQIFHWHGHAISYQQAGQGAVILLLHSFPGSSWDWHALWPALAQHGTVVAPDLLGCGDSDKPWPYYYSLGSQAELIRALLKRLGTQHCHIIAHDSGALIAHKLIAVNRHHSIKPLSMHWLNPRHPRFNWHWRERLWASASGNWWCRGLSAAGLQRYYQACARLPLPRHYCQDAFELLQAHGGLRVLSALLAYRHEPWEWLHPPAGYSGPVQLISGQQRHALWLQRAFMQAQHVKCAAGHWPHLEMPELLYLQLQPYLPPAGNHVLTNLLRALP